MVFTDFPEDFNFPQVSFRRIRKLSPPPKKQLIHVNGKFMYDELTILPQTTVNPIFYHIHTEMCLQGALGAGEDIGVKLVAMLAWNRKTPN